MPYHDALQIYKQIYLKMQCNTFASFVIMYQHHIHNGKFVMHGRVCLAHMVILMMLSKLNNPLAKFRGREPS